MEFLFIDEFIMKCFYLLFRDFLGRVLFSGFGFDLYKGSMI